MTSTVTETETKVVNFTEDGTPTGPPYDPDLVFVRLKSPSGTLTSPAVDNAAVGEYRFTFAGGEAGVYRGTVHGEGPDGHIVIIPFHHCFEEYL